ncbi:MAG: hypothetical protein COS85_07245 [Armatimonadetes bacterium CG07_land_8_20_14_0_80_59_28]|nr:MAG: hypothetical protein COS85_07245 [Armatimonadetes bacterium CG07_land_8_20_14_0_80_59_28]
MKSHYYQNHSPAQKPPHRRAHSYDTIPVKEPLRNTQTQLFDTPAIPAILGAGKIPALPAQGLRASTPDETKEHR